MNFLRKLVVFVATTTFTLLLFLTVITTAISTTITPANIKSWLKHSDVYYNAVDAIFDSTASATQKNTQDNSDIFSNPDVKKAVKSAFPPSLLQSSSESFIDGTFVWLEGKSTKPTFVINLTEAKNNLANNIANFASTRYKALPVCKTIPPPDTNALDAKCRIPNYDISKDIAKLKKDIATNKQILGNPPIFTADSIKSGGANSVPAYQKAASLPSIYKIMKITPIVFAVLSLFALLTLMFVSLDKNKGYKKASVSLFITSALLFIFAWSVKFVLGKASNNLLDAGNSAGKFAQKTALSIANDIANHIVHVNLVFGAVFLILGIVLLIIRSKLISPKGANHDETQPSAPTKVSETK